MGFKPRPADMPLLQGLSFYDAANAYTSYNLFAQNPSCAAAWLLESILLQYLMIERTQALATTQYVDFNLDVPILSDWHELLIHNLKSYASHAQSAHPVHNIITLMP